jgi:hypothetical protein
MLADWIHSNEGDANKYWLGLDSNIFITLFDQALRIGNMELLTQFDGNVYQQLNGLAMGVADSPDLANLYGWFCEKRDGLMLDSHIAFYGRYINDCIGIVYAHSPQDVLLIRKTFKS